MVKMETAYFYSIFGLSVGSFLLACFTFIVMVIAFLKLQARARALR